MHRSDLTETGSEADALQLRGRRLESLDDIPREIADRRLHAEFGSLIEPEKSQILREVPDKIEERTFFENSAEKTGIKDAEGIIGWSTNLESPAHVLKGEVPREVATLVHEDLHRLTHAETLAETSADPVLRELYEGVTEYLSQHAVEDVHGNRPGEAYPEQTAFAGQLAGEVGDEAIEAWYFRHEVSDQLQQAITKLQDESRA